MVNSLYSLFGLLAVLQASPAAPGGGAVGSGASASSIASPQATGGVSTTSTNGSTAGGSSFAPAGNGLPRVAPGQTLTLTLQQVVDAAVNSNTNVVLAKERLAEAAEGINQVNAEGKPQLVANLADTYASFGETEATFGPSVANPTVPTGTTIPTVVDQAADFSSAFGIGAAASNTSSFGSAYGAPLSATGSSMTLPATNSSLPGSSSSTSLPGINGSTGSAGTTGTPGTTAPTSGSGASPSTAPSYSTTPDNSTTTGGASNSSGSGAGTSPGMTPGSTVSTSTSPPTTGTSFELAPMPMILQNYVTESSVPSVVANTSETDEAKSADAETSAPAKTDDAAVAKSDATGKQPDQTTTTSSPTVETEVANNTSRNNYGARVDLSQYIDAFGLLGAARDAEKLNRDFYSIDIDRTQNEVALSAKNLFFNVILAEQEVATEQEQVNDSVESVRVTNALVQQGQAAGFDLLSAQTTLANNQQLLTSAKNQLSFAVADLDYLLGVGTDTPINLVPPPLPPLNQGVDLQQSTTVALQRRPEIIEANKNVELAKKLVKIASEGLTPTIGLVGTYGYNSTATVAGPANEGLISAQVEIPFDDGGATRSRIREAKDVLDGQVTTLDELKLSVALEVRQAYLNVLDGQTQASTAQTGVDLANETLRVANVQYQNGLGTILDVENAQAQLATARTNLANAQYTYQTALASLVRAVGSR